MADVIGKSLSAADKAARLQRFKDACALQEIEGNPLTPDEIALFEKFERENWSHERIRAYFISEALADAKRT
jgi:hypothetical protein